MTMFKVVLLRHGESAWNKENRFTGWTDVDLSELGIKEAKEAGETLKKEGYAFDLVFTSVLRRAIATTNTVTVVMGLNGVETRYAWQLNERHYGALQGLNKKEMAQKYGEEQVHIWRRSFSVRPPELDDAAFADQANQGALKSIPRSRLPRTESLFDTYGRAVAYWKSDIAPQVRAGKKILVSAHGNSLRAIVKFLDGVSDEEISGINIPTGIPLVYELGTDLKPLRHYYLGDQKVVAARINKVAAQGKAK